MNLWKLIFHITQIVQFLDDAKRDLSVHFVGPSHFLSVTEKNLPAVQAVMQEYMYQLGYRREEIYVTAELVGSRELLLGFAWLLSRTNLFSSLTKHLLAVAKRTEIPLKTTHQHILEQVLDENSRTRSDVESVTSSLKQVEGKDSSQDTCTSALHKLVWLRGCVDQKCKLMRRAHLAYQKSVYKIHQSTRDCSTSAKGTRNLSVHEVFLLRYPNQLKAYLHKLGKCVSVLQKLVQWQECEPLFWQWMESVVDLQEEEEAKAKQDEKDEHTKSTGDDKEAMLTEWNKLQEEMEHLLEKNRLHMERLNHILEHKTRTLEQELVNREEQYLKKQLQFECPLVSPPVKSTSPVVISMLEELNAIDKPALVSVGAAVVRSSKAFSTSGVLHQTTGAETLEVTRGITRGAMDEVEALDTAVEDIKSRIKRTLESLEQRLPSTLCKLEQHPL